MTRDLQTKLANDWQQIIDDLTPEQRQMLAKSTPKDWVDAIAELVTERSFWEGILQAFLQGIADGLEDFNATRR